MHWFPMYQSDFLGATIGLSCAERSLYALSLIIYYEAGPFPTERVRAYRVIGCESDEQKRAIDFILENFYVLREDGWYQPQAEEIKAKQAQYFVKLSEAGKRGNAKRWHSGIARRSPGDGEAIAGGSRGDRNPYPKPQPNPKPKPNPDPKPKPPLPPLLPDWLPAGTWEEYLSHRRAKRAGLTPNSIRLVIKKLSAFREKGMDPQAVIEQSIANGWTGLFPLQRDHQKSGIQEWLESQTSEDLWIDQPDKTDENP